MERTVLVQVCSSGFVAFVSFQHITPDRLSQIFAVEESDWGNS